MFIVFLPADAGHKTTLITFGPKKWGHARFPIRFPPVDGKRQKFVGLGRSPLGPLGCALSHRDLVGSLVGASLPVIICEDDLEFVGRGREIWSVIEAFGRDPRLDVLCLAANVGDEPIPISQHLAISQNIATTACYVVKPLAIPLLENVFRESAERLKSGEGIETASLDQRWKILQRWSLIFSVPAHRLAR